MIESLIWNPDVEAGIPESLRFAPPPSNAEQAKARKEAEEKKKKKKKSRVTKKEQATGKTRLRQKT